MQKKQSDTPVGKLRIIDDFLPSPEELSEKDETQKITIRLSKRSINFFKEQAVKNRTKYQRMLRQLIERYTDRYIFK